VAGGPVLPMGSPIIAVNRGAGSAYVELEEQEALVAREGTARLARLRVSSSVTRRATPSTANSRRSHG
jgi:hypothetical protein